MGALAGALGLPGCCCVGVAAEVSRQQRIALILLAEQARGDTLSARLGFSPWTPARGATRHMFLVAVGCRSPYHHPVAGTRLAAPMTAHRHAIFWALRSPAAPFEGGCCGQSPSTRL